MNEVKKPRPVLRGIIALAVSLVLLAADQVIKFFVLRDLKPVGSVTLIPGLLELSYVENTGAAFGLFQGQVWPLAVGTFLAAGVIVALLFRYRSHSLWSYISATLILAGGIGNLIDRLCYGFVVDFIHVLFFGYIFNFADCCITVGAVLFLVHVVLLTLREKREAKAAAEEGSNGGETP